MKSSIAAFSNEPSILVLFFLFQQFSNPSSSSASATPDLSINTWAQQIDLTFPVLLQVLFGQPCFWPGLTLTLALLLAAADYRCSVVFASLMNVSALFHLMADVWEIMCEHALTVHCFLLVGMAGGGMVNMHQVPQALLVYSEWLLTTQQMPCPCSSQACLRKGQRNHIRWTWPVLIQI